MQTNSLHHNHSSFILPFNSGICEKEGEKLQKIEYLKNEKSFLDETKSVLQKYICYFLNFTIHYRNHVADLSAFFDSFIL